MQAVFSLPLSRDVRGLWKNIDWVNMCTTLDVVLLCRTGPFVEPNLTKVIFFVENSKKKTFFWHYLINSPKQLPWSVFKRF
jgi:hypothetical protein